MKKFFLSIIFFNPLKVFKTLSFLASKWKKSKQHSINAIQCHMLFFDFQRFDASLTQSYFGITYIPKYE